MGGTVLIVEDGDACAATLEIALAGIPGVRVRRVRTAEEALLELSAEGVCALLTDLQLPAMSGFDLIGHVRREPRLAGLPVLVISGDPDPGAPARALALGANAFFGKPFSPAAVRHRLEGLIHAT